MVTCAFAAIGRSAIANIALINRSFILLVLLNTAPRLQGFRRLPQGVSQHLARVDVGQRNCRGHRLSCLPIAARSRCFEGLNKGLRLDLGSLLNVRARFPFRRLITIQRAARATADLRFGSQADMLLVNDQAKETPKA